MGSRGGRRSFPAAGYIPAETLSSVTSKSSYNENEPAREAFIDHRNLNDLANISASASRTRRRYSTGKDLPLTNKNLQTLYNHSKSVALDMDAFASEQTNLTDISELAKEHGWNNPFETLASESNNHSDSYSINSYGFGESNPPSEHSDCSSSLDDVFAPDKQHTLSWPDLKVMEEFIFEEYHDLQDELEEDKDALAELTPRGNLHSNANSSKNTSNIQSGVSSGVQSPGYSGQSIPQSPGKSNNYRNNISPGQSQVGKSHLYKNLHSDYDSPKHKSPALSHRRSLDSSYLEDSPLLNSYQVNEEDSIHVHEDALRVRPQPIQPWETMPSILKNKKDPMPRFTYFREDLDKTIHSASISGLILSESGDDTMSKLQELFSPSHYSKTLTRKTSSTSLANQSVSSHTHNADSEIKLTSLTPIETGQGTNSTNVNDSIESDTRKTPFWLDVLDPTEDEMKVISKTFGIHPLTTEDIFLGEAREKVEVFNNYYFVCFTSFDIVYERRKQREKEKEKMIHKLQELMEQEQEKNWWNFSSWFKESKGVPLPTKDIQSVRSTGKKIRSGELVPLNMYMIVFQNAVISFHFSQTPHPINVRRRARLLRDHITVTSDWISYALIDDITDSFAPMIESIEDEVNAIEDAILKMQSLESDSDDSDDEELTTTESLKGIKLKGRKGSNDENLFFKRPRSRSTVEIGPNGVITKKAIASSRKSSKSSTSRSLSSRSTDSKVLRWRRQGDMLRRIGECRKRVMSILRLLGTKADVVKAFSKRFNENNGSQTNNRSEIGMYLGDIQDHIVTMFQSLNHYEKLLARFHANYLAQINIDMTKVNNDTNDVLGKLTVMGTIVLPLNVITGLWGMNCIVPGQEYEGLAWFFGIVGFMTIFSWVAFNYAKRVTNL